jgi:hypothetical protein
VADPIPFPDDRDHATYDATQVERFFRVLSMVDIIFTEHRAGFRGRTTPVEFFWGTFDLALIRYSGRPAPPPPGAGVIGRFGGDAEAICAGWWPGDERARHPAFYAYGYPKPPGLEEATIAPPGAGWDKSAGEFLLSYDTVRSASDPRQAVLDFARTTYAAAARVMRWDDAWTEVAVPSAAAAAGAAAAQR